MSQFSELTLAEIAELLAGQKSNKRHKPRHCPTCLSVFKPKRTNQIYCSVKCREEFERTQRLRELEVFGERVCQYCGRVLHESMKLTAKYCSPKCRALAFKAKPCYYCGEIADTKDHFIPRAFKKRIEDLGRAVDENILVPACKECNSTAGAKVFRTLKEKRAFIHEQYRKKYAKILDAPIWAEDEIAALGPTLRSHVRTSQEAKIKVKARLLWPRRYK